MAKPQVTNPVEAITIEDPLQTHLRHCVVKWEWNEHVKYRFAIQGNCWPRKPEFQIFWGHPSKICTQYVPVSRIYYSIWVWKMYFITKYSENLGAVPLESSAFACDDVLIWSLNVDQCSLLISCSMKRYLTHRISVYFSAPSSCLKWRGYDSRVFFSIFGLNSKFSASYHTTRAIVY